MFTKATFILIKNRVKIEYCELYHYYYISLKCYSYDCKAQFSPAIIPVFSATWSLRNPSNMVINMVK